MGRQSNRVAFVAGTALGQGHAYCVRLAEEGADIAIDIVGPVAGSPPWHAFAITNPDLNQRPGRMLRCGIGRDADARALTGAAPDATKLCALVTASREPWDLGRQ